MVIPLLLVGCGGYQDGLVKFPVHGKVLVDGQPESGVVVRFIQMAGKSKANGAFPVGVTDDQGDFQLGTNSRDDGAVAGDYTVVFVWPEQNEPPPGDHFGGVYNNHATSQFRISVLPEKNELETFELIRKASSQSLKRRDD